MSSPHFSEVIQRDSTVETGDPSGSGQGCLYESNAPDTLHVLCVINSFEFILCLIILHGFDLFDVLFCFVSVWYVTQVDHSSRPLNHLISLDLDVVFIILLKCL